MAKDKYAAKRKARRNILKQQLRNQQAHELLAAVHEEQRKLGLPITTDVPAEKLLKAYIENSREVAVNSIMYCVAVTMRYLYEVERFNQEQLLDFTAKCNNITIAVGTDDRPISKLIEDLQYADVDVCKYVSLVKCDVVAHIKRIRNIELRMIYDKIIGGITIVLFTMYNYFGWCNKCIDRMGVYITDKLSYILSVDGIDEFITNLYDETKILVSLDGKIQI